MAINYPHAQHNYDEYLVLWAGNPKAGYQGMRREDDNDEIKALGVMMALKSKDRQRLVSDVYADWLCASRGGGLPCRRGHLTTANEVSLNARDSLGVREML